MFPCEMGRLIAVALRNRKEFPRATAHRPNGRFRPRKAGLTPSFPSISRLFQHLGTFGGHFLAAAGAAGLGGGGAGRGGGGGGAGRAICGAGRGGGGGAVTRGGGG